MNGTPAGLGSPGSAPAADDTGARVLGLLLVAALVGTVNGLSRVAMPLFAASLGAPAWQVGMVGGLGYAGMLLLSLPLGAWIDRHGSRPVFTRGVLVSALLYGGMMAVASPWQAVLGAAVLGLVLPLRVVPAHTEFLALLPRLSPAKAGWNRAANTVGMFFVGPAVSAAVIAALGFPPVFALASAGLLTAFLLGRRVFGDAPPAHAAAALPLLQRVRSQWTIVRTDEALRRTMVIDFVAQLSVAYFVVFVIVLATRSYQLPLQAAAGLVTVQGASYVAVLFAGGAWVMRWHEDLRYAVAFALLGAQGLLCGLGGTPTALWLGATLMGLGMGLQGLASTARFAALMQRHGRGRIGGLGSIGPPAGGVLGAMLGGLVSQSLGTEAGFVLLGLGCSGMALVQWRQWRHALHAASLVERTPS